MRKNTTALMMVFLIVMLPIVQAQSLQGPETSDTTSPQISNVLLTHGPQTIVTWTTNEPASSKVDFGNTSSLDQNMTKSDLETAHSLTLQTTAGTTYNYRITSCDFSNNCRSTTLASFIAGPFYVKAEVPRYPRSTKIDISGSTRLGAEVTILVNNVEVRKDIIEDGEFLFKNVELKPANNTVIVKAVLGTETAQQTYQADVDNQPPIINVTMPAVSTAASVTAKIKISEPANLTIEYQKPTGDKPLRPTELTETAKTATYVELKWKPATDIQEQIIYRSGKRIAKVSPTETKYRDSTVAANTEYEYQASSVSAKCIESDLSDILTTKTETGTNQGLPPAPILLTCEKPPKYQSIPAGTTDIRLELQEGENIITFTAQDKSGYKSIAEERVIFDIGPPRFLETNLKQLSPTYTRQVIVKGKLSEQGSVTAYVNGKPQKTVATAADGTFSIPVTLERGITVGVTGKIAANIDTGVAWKSKVKLEAVDAAGQKTSTEESEIEYALCGSGTAIDVQLTDPLPDTLNPRLMIEGVQQIGIAFNYTYRGGHKAVIETRTVRIKKLQLAPDVQKEFDNGLVLVNSPPVRAQRAGQPSGAGYIQVNFQPITDPWSLQDKDTKPEPGPANATMYEREKRISDHRQGECLTPGFGCVKLFLELEIPYQEVTKKQTYDPRVQQTLETDVPENKVQRSCVNVQVMIDQRIPPDYIPSGFLKTVSKTLGSIIEGIDKVLNPINTIGKYLFYTCVAGTFLSFIPIFLEKYNCQYSAITTAVSGGQGAFKEEIAAIGACDEEYGADTESGKNCKSCEDWKDKRQWFERTYRQVCDRVMCPAAPSLQYYLKTKGARGAPAVGTEQAHTTMTQYATGTSDNKLHQGSDCAAWIDKNRRTTEKGTQAQVLAPRLFFSNEDIQGIYTKWLEHKSDTSSSQSTAKLNCAGLHPAHPECCGFEYMQEWSSACGVSALGDGLDTFDEIKESTCLSSQQIGKNDIKGLQGSTIQCNKLLNSLSGFCDKAGGPPLTTIRVTSFAQAKSESLGLQRYGESQDLYIIVQDKGKMSGGIISTGQSGGHSVRLGVIVKTLEFQQSKQEGILATSEQSKLTEKLDVVEYPGYTAFQTTWFSDDKIKAFRQSGNPPVVGSQNFGQALCDAAGKGTNCPDIGNGKSQYEQVLASMGSPDKEYIIKPNDGLINSIRCLCFPTIIGYLKMWRNIMSAVQRCINTILVTGDGDTGVCQAVISQYACDLLYEVLACFTQQFSTGQERKGGVGDIMGALSSAGSEMSRSVESRYGETGMYKAVFVDRKLVHSICMWAFTGTWNFDLSAVYDQSVDEIPLNSQALIMPCNRRFVAFNPATKPGGLVTWVYHFGVFVASGADIELELHLKCSNDFSCKESDGFEKGKCDCEGRIAVDTVAVPDNLPSRVKRNEIINEEIFYTMQGSLGNGQVRYDKAYIVYRWKEAGKTREEKTTPCTISQTGGAGSIPAFCRYEPFTLSFRCQFGEAEGGVRFTKGTPNHPRALQGTPSFAVGDNLNITLDIQQDHTGKEGNNKHLEFQVMNSANQVLMNNSDRGYILLATNGDYQKTIGTSNSPYTITVSKDWFGGAETGKKYSAKQWSSARKGTLPEVNTFVADALLYQASGTQDTQNNKQYILELTNTAGKYEYVIYGAPQAQSPTLDAQNGFTGKTLTPVCAKTTLPGDNIFCTMSAPATNTTPATSAGDLRITLTANRPQPGETLQVWININPPTGLADLCGKGKLSAAPFKVRFTAYDSDQFGQPTDQVSMDPNGGEATIEVPFNAVCAANTDPDLIAKATGAAPPGEAISGLRELVNTMITKEQAFIKQLEKGTEWDPTQPSTYSQLQTELNDIAAFEIKSIGDLDQYNKSATQIGQTVPVYMTLIQPINNVAEALKLAANITQTRKDKIDKIPPPRNRNQIIPELQPIRDELVKIQTIKQALNSTVVSIVGAPGVCAPGVDSTGNYFECRATCVEPYAEVTANKCSGFDRCCKISTEEYCGGPLKENYNYTCSSLACPTGWEEAKNYTKYMSIGPLSGNVTFNLKCPLKEQKQVCCKQSTLGAKTTATEQVATLRQFFDQMLPDMRSERDNYKALTQIYPPEALTQLYPDNKAKLIDDFEFLAKKLEIYLDGGEGAVGLNQILERPIDGTSKVPQEVGAYKSLLGISPELIRTQSIQKLKDATKSSDVISAYSAAYATLNGLADNEYSVLAKIDYALGATPCGPGKYGYRITECMSGSNCPTLEFTNPLNDKSKWRQVTFGTCLTGEVCCTRSSYPIVMIKKDGTYVETDYHENVTASSNIDLMLKIPYYKQGDVQSIKYGDLYPFGKDRTTTNSLSISNLNYGYDTTNKFASIEIKGLTMPSSPGLYFMDFNVTPQYHYYFFQGIRIQ